MNEAERTKRDAVTVGQIRKRYLLQLENQIITLNGLIRQGYEARGRSEKFLSESIGQTLTTLQNIDAFAATELLFPVKDK